MCCSSTATAFFKSVAFMRMTWDRVAKFCRSLYFYHQSQWRCRVPDYSQDCEPVLETQCDLWCEQIARHPMHRCPAPPAVQPWLLARLLSVSSAIKAGRYANVSPPGALDESLLRQLLIADWHAHLKQTWNLLDDGLAFAE